MKIHVGGVPYEATESQLKELFEEYGPIASVTIIKDDNTRKSKGFGFVEMENQADAARAIEKLDGHKMMRRFLRVSPARQRGQRQQARRQRSSTQRSHEHRQSLPDDTFHNPYTFVPTPPRGHIKVGEFAGDFNPLECGLGLSHDTLHDDRWTGHIPIKLTTVTPLVLPKTDGEERDSTKHQTYDVLDYIPESSLRGMLRSAYEVVTNSRYGCFSNSDRLAYRMMPREALDLIPAIIKDGGNGKLVARLYTGTSTPINRGPSGPMYAAMLRCYPSSSACVAGYNPQTGDEVCADIVLRTHTNPHYQFWKAINVWPKGSPSPTTTKKEISGHVFITNQNIKDKHDERIFFSEPSPAATKVIDNPYKVTPELEKAWGMRIKSYREAHTDAEIFGRSGARDEPWKYIGHTPGKTAWSPHQYQDNTHRNVWTKDPHGRKTTHDAIELRAGDMVYARCKFDSSGKIEKIEDLFPVMISRELYDASPENLLDDSLKPAERICELSPADRLFGWVAQKRTPDENGKTVKAYKSRIRVVCDDPPQPESIQRFNGGGSLPLTILGQPKPAQGRFYVAKDAEGNSQNDGIPKSDAGYAEGKGLRGRKHYWHHKGYEAENDPKYWDPSAENREYRRTGGIEDSQNRSIKGWIKPGTEFKVSLYVQNLQPEEVGALLWLLTLPEDCYFRLGYGKPLGFGSLRMEIDTNRLVCRSLPLGKGENWQTYYSTFDDCPPATLDTELQSDCLKEFKESMTDAYHSGRESDTKNSNKDQNRSSRSMSDQLAAELLKSQEGEAQLKAQHFDALPFIKGFLKVLRGPSKDIPIHYPRTNPKRDPDGKNFEWFMDNENGRSRRVAKRDEVGKQLSLPDVNDDDQSLPYIPSNPKTKKRGSCKK